MASHRLSAIRLSAPVIFVFVVLGISLVLLIGKRLDAPWAGGKGAGPQHDAVLIKSLFFDLGDPSSAALRDANPSLPQTLTRGETASTDANTFAAYEINNECTVYLAENSSLLLEDGRNKYNVFNLLTGRAVAEGDCTFVTRETEIDITTGTATLVHFSWLNELIVKVFAGGAVISQSGNDTFLVHEDAATRFFTLPSESHAEPTAFSTDENETTTSFYSWSLTPPIQTPDASEE